MALFNAESINQLEQLTKPVALLFVGTIRSHIPGGGKPTSGTQGAAAKHGGTAKVGSFHLLRQTPAQLYGFDAARNPQGSCFWRLAKNFIASFHLELSRTTSTLSQVPESEFLPAAGRCYS